MRPSTRPPGTLILALVAAAVFGLLAAGCDNGEKTSGVEGDYVKVGETLYQVQQTRLMNPNARPDDDYLTGQPPLSPKEQYLGVFLTIENDGRQPYTPPRDMKVIDTQGNEYLPQDASGGGFGLDFVDPIPPDQVAPPPDSPAASGPQGGALVLFRVKEESATDNLPLDLQIPDSGGQESRIRLDV